MASKSSLPSAGVELEARAALLADRLKRKCHSDSNGSSQPEPSESESASHSSDRSVASAHSNSRQQRKKAKRAASRSARRRSRSRSRSRSASPSPSSDNETPSSASSASSSHSASSSVSSHSEYLPSDRSANSGSDSDEDSDGVVSMDESNSDAESDRRRKARRAAPRSKRRHSVSSSPSASSADEPAPSSQADDQAEPDRSDAQSDGDDEPEPPHEDAAKSSSDEEEEGKEESDEGDEPDDSSSDSHLSDPEWTPSNSGSDADEDSASEESDSNSDAESDSDIHPLEDDQFCVDEEAFLEMCNGEYKELVLRRQVAYRNFQADLVALRIAVSIPAEYFPPYRFRAARKWKGYYKEAERWINTLQPNFSHFKIDIDKRAEWSAVWNRATAQIGPYTVIWLHVTVGSGGHSNLLILDHESALVASSAGGAASSSASSSSARRPASASASASSSHRQLKSAWIFEPHGYAKHADRPTLKEFLHDRNFEWRSCYKANSKQRGPQSLECRSTFHSSLNFLTNRGNCLLWSCLFIHCLLAGSSVEKAAKALRTLADDSAAILMSTYLTRVVRDLQLKGQPAAALESSDGRRLHPYEKGVALLRKTLRSRLGKPAGFALFLYDVEAGRRDRQPHPKYRGVFYRFPSAEITVAAVLQEASVYFNKRVCTMVREYLSGPPGKAVVCLRSGLALTPDVARKLPIGAMQQRAPNRFQLWIYRPEESQVRSICKERGLCVKKLFLDGSTISAHPGFHWSEWTLRSLWGPQTDALSNVDRIRVSFECRWSKRETGGPGPARPGRFTWTFPARRWSDLTVAYLWTKFLRRLHTRRKEWIAEAAAAEQAQAAGARPGSSAKSNRSQCHRQLQCMLEAATKGLRHWRDVSVELLDDSDNELDIPTRKEVAAEKSRLRQLAKEAAEKEEQRQELAPLKALILQQLVSGRVVSRAVLKNKVQSVKTTMDQIQLVLDEVADVVESATGRKEFRLKAGIHSSADKE